MMDKEQVSLYVVEICRYGNMSNTQLYGVFDLSIVEVLEHMKKYNKYRGGKYPRVRVTKILPDMINNKGHQLPHTLSKVWDIDRDSPICLTDLPLSIPE